MNSTRLFILLGSLSAALLASLGVARGETIVLRTGQAVGLPGICGSIDDSFRFNPVSLPPCPAPFRGSAFTATDFADATTGPPARVVDPYTGFWLPTLSFDPQARWIASGQTAQCFGDAQSVLYACPFNVETACDPTATVEICWAADDYLGDPSGPNGVGFYINEMPLNSVFSGGSYGIETCRTQSNVPLKTGTNWLYVYQRDGACAVSGLLCSVRITTNPAPPCPQLALFKFEDLDGDGIRGANEPPLAGWTFNVLGGAGYSGTTDANGLVIFPCIPAGSYVVTEVTQPGWIVTTPPGGQQPLEVTCDQDYAVTFGNRRCEAEPVGCTQPPSCLTAVFPMNECGGLTVNEVAANNDGTVLGTNPPTWGPGRPGSSCGLHFGPVASGWVEAPDAPEHDFGAGSFTVAAWVKNTSTDGLIRTVLDKRVDIGNVVGYALYLVAGQVWFQYDDGVGTPTNHASTAPAISDGAWHHLSVAVCRDPGNPSNNVTRIMVDSYVDTFTGSSIPTGSLSNTAGLRIGEQCPGFILNWPFNGAIDDVMLFKCCLTPAQIVSLQTSSEYCFESCYLKQVQSTGGDLAQTDLVLCNYSIVPQTYTWTIAGLPAGSGCSVDGPSQFYPLAGTITVPGAVSGPACVSIPITIVLPNGMGLLDTACYQVTTQNLGSGRCCTRQGKLRRTYPFDPVADPVDLALPIDTPTQISFSITNLEDGAMDFDYWIEAQSDDGDEGNEAVRLNGLPPGTPIKGVLSIAPGQHAVLNIDVELSAFQPLNTHEVVFYVDLDGDGSAEEDLMMCSIRSLPAPGAPVGVEHATEPTLPVREASLSVSPNPFRGETMLRLVIPRDDGGIRVEIFDAGGRLVRKLLSGPLPAGEHFLQWDARDDHGDEQPLGIYFVRAKSPSTSIGRKLIRLE